MIMLYLLLSLTNYVVFEKARIQMDVDSRSRIKFGMTFQM